MQFTVGIFLLHSVKCFYRNLHHMMSVQRLEHIYYIMLSIQTSGKMLSTLLDLKCNIFVYKKERNSTWFLQNNEKDFINIIYYFLIYDKSLCFGFLDNLLYTVVTLSFVKHVLVSEGPRAFLRGFDLLKFGALNM